MARTVTAIRVLLKDASENYLIPYVDIAEGAKTDRNGNVIDETYVTHEELATLAPSAHTHAIADITNLQSTLDGKAASSHTHSYLPLSGGTVSGNLTVTGTTSSDTFKATSDVRLKSDIEKFTMDLSSLSVYRYRLNSDGCLHVGLIAQEVEKVIPEAVSEGESGWKSLDYNAVVAALVGEVNSLKARISELEKRK